MLALYFLTVLVVYNLPGIFGHVLFLIYFLVFYKSKKDYFWLAFWFIINTGPGGFFYVSEKITTGQLPVFKLGEGVNILVTEVFLVLAILKALNKGKKQHIPLAKPMVLLLCYSLFLFMVSYFVFGTTAIRFLKDIRYFFYFFFIIPLNYLVYKDRDGEKLMYCLFPFVFITFFTAVYYVFTGDYFINLLAPGLKEQSSLGIQAGGFRYNMSGRGEHLVLLISYIVSLFFIFRGVQSLKENRYLLMVAGISYITILSTATRLWFIVFTFIFAAGIMLLQKNLRKISWISVMIIFFVLFYLLVPKINDFTNRSWTRISSVFEINKKNSLAYIQIENKKKYRLKKTMVGIAESPLIGLGDSTRFFECTGGGDIGNFNLILQVGILGFLLFINLWIRFFILVLKSNRGLSPHNPYRGTILLFNISFIGLLISHFTTHQIFAMIITHGYGIFVMLFIFMSGYFARDALKTEYYLQYMTVMPLNTLNPVHPVHPVNPLNQVNPVSPALPPYRQYPALNRGENQS
jgi:hypothetical protein